MKPGPFPSSPAVEPGRRQQVPAGRLWTGRSGSPRKTLPRGFPCLAQSFLLLLCWDVWGPPLANSAQQSAAAESGVFSILSGKRRIGTEKFQITPVASGLEATGEIQLNVPGGPRAVESCSLRLDPDLRPISYERQQKSPKQGSITAEFGSPESTLVSKTEAGTENRIFYLPDKDLVILDTNFFHHYQFLLRLYDNSRPGPQHFNVFIPQEAVPGDISVTFQGREVPIAGETSGELNHFQIVSDEVQIEIWATPEGKIHRISIPQAKLEVVRQE